MDVSMAPPHIFLGVPILGATLGLFFRTKPKAMIVWFLIVTSLEMGLLVFIPPPMLTALTAPMILLIAFSACLAVLAHPIHFVPSSELFNILFFCGLGFGFLFRTDRLGLVYLAGIFALLFWIQLRSSRFSDPKIWWTLGLYVIGIVSLLSAFFLAGFNRQIALLLVYMTLLPLFPFHGVYISLLGTLPGLLPAFLSIFLPVLGLSGLISVLSDLPLEVNRVLLACAILGVISGSLRSLVKNSVPARLSQIALVYWSILWWYIAGPEAKTPPAIIFLCAAALTICGLFLAWQGLKSRYGDLAEDQFGGLASTMPRFAVVFSLLIAAGMGLPLFGLFSGFIEMTLSHSGNLTAGLVIILFSWFLVSWAFSAFMQKILFGPEKTNWIYRDFGRGELISLSLIVVVLIMIGIAPYRLFGLGNLPHITSPISDLASWRK